MGGVIETEIRDKIKAEAAAIDARTTTLESVSKPGNTAKVIADTSSALTLTSAAHAGRIVTFGKLTGVDITLPAATGTGDVYTLIRALAATSNTDTILVSTLPGTDIFSGGVFTMTNDTDNGEAWWTASDSDTITLDITTTGGVAPGEKFVFTDIASGVWNVIGFTNSAGTEATPFSANIAAPA